MKPVLAAFASGLLFGLGLVISQMINPAKVIGFLDIFGAWDPSLALVMAAAVAASGAGYLVARRLGAPLLGRRLKLPQRRDLDSRLVGGAALFGVGWGLAGFCPGPAITALPLGLWEPLVFVAAMLCGMMLFRLLPAGDPASPSLQRADG